MGWELADAQSVRDGEGGLKTHLSCFLAHLFSTGLGPPGMGRGNEWHKSILWGVGSGTPHALYDLKATQMVSGQAVSLSILVVDPDLQLDP